MELFGQAASVLFVLALLGGGLYVLRAKGIARFSLKTMSGSGARRMQLVERLSLTAQHSLHLVRVRGKMLVIAVSPSGCTVLESGSQGSFEDEKAGAV